MLRNAEYVLALRRVLDLKTRSPREYRAAFERLDLDGSGYIEARAQTPREANPDPGHRTHPSLALARALAPKPSPSPSKVREIEQAIASFDRPYSEHGYGSV